MHDRDAFLILGAGTEIGKTHISAALLKAARHAGHAPLALKPLMSGFDPSDLAHSDAGQLLNACGRRADQNTVDEICLYQFEEAVSPNIAARRLGRRIDPQATKAFLQQRLAQSQADFTIIEGAGGVLSPLSDDMLQADFFAQLKLPAVLVAANYLGAISHTLSAAEALQTRKIALAAIVVSQPSAEAPSPDGLTDELARYVSVPMHTAPFNGDQDALGEALYAQLTQYSRLARAAP